MFKNLIKPIIFISLFVLIKPGYSQHGFDVYLSQDSVYRYNSTFSEIDSILKNNSVKIDTSFSNTFGRAEVINLDQLIYFALNNSPEIKAMQTRIEAEKKLAYQKAYLPDPMFEFELDDIMTDFKQVGMINFFLSQMFMFPGKLKLDKEAVLHNVDMMNVDIIDMSTNMINMIKMNYFDLYFNEQKMQINKENQLLMKNLISAAEIRYSTAKGMQMDVFKGQVEFSKLVNEEAVLKRERMNLLSNLTSLTKVVIDENTKINFSSIDVDFLLNDNNFQVEKIDVNKLVNYAFQKRADLQSIYHRVLMSKTDLEMAKKSRYPDFNVKVGYKILPMEETNAFSFMVGVNIPIAPWTSGKYDYAIQRSTLGIKAANLEYETKRNEIRNQIDTTLNRLIANKNTVKYYKDVVIPQSENSLKSTQYSYESGMTTFIDILEAYRMYTESKLMFYESVNMYLKMISDLERVTGMNIK
ncbi:MAG: TolC family protein [Ignavibacteriae bacterium]|nr:MAG: TolC family protein [Ignavibacteriota bacterium]